MNQSVNIPLVSIALCTYNGERYLATQLDSLINQDYENLEIVIVDDCSTDHTIQLIKSYQVKNNNIKLIINELNIGFNQNFNKAIANCSGQYIAIADQDDIWSLKKISIMMESIGKNLMLYHNSSYIDETGILNGLSTTSHHRFVAGDCAINLLYYNCISGHACLLKKELLELTPLFPDTLYYDWWLAYTAACTGRINFIRNKLVEHRIHKYSITQKDTTNAKALRIIHFNLFLQHPSTPKPVELVLRDLLSGYDEISHKRFSLKLFLYLLKKNHQLFYVRKKSIYSKLKIMLRESTR